MEHPDGPLPAPSAGDEAFALLDLRRHDDDVVVPAVRVTG